MGRGPSGRVRRPHRSADLAAAGLGGLPRSLAGRPQPRERSARRRTARGGAMATTTARSTSQSPPAAGPSGSPACGSTTWRPSRTRVAVEPLAAAGADRGGGARPGRRRGRRPGGHRCRRRRRALAPHHRPAATAGARQPAADSSARAPPRGPRRRGRRHPLGAGACVPDPGRTSPRAADGRPTGDRPRSGTIYRDVDYPDYGLVVELDGRLWHRSAADRDRDLARDLVAKTDGRDTVRLGWGQATRHACADRAARRRAVSAGAGGPAGCSAARPVPA